MSGLARYAQPAACAGGRSEQPCGRGALGLPGLPAARITLPAGFTGQAGGVWVNDLGEDDWGHLGITTTGDVFPDPCRRTAAPPSNSSIDDFAEALAAQKVTTTTEPVPVSLGGHDGLRLTVSVPAGVAVNRCTGGELVLWQLKDGGLEGLGPDTVVRLWVVDVDGQLMVLQATTLDVATEETVELVSGIAGSATFAES